SASAASAASLRARLAPVRWGRGSASRSRYSTLSPGCCADHCATMAALSSRLTELAPRALESRWRSFMAGDPCWRRCRGGPSFDRCAGGIKVVRWHLLLRPWSRIMQDLSALYYFAMVVEHGGFAAAERALGIPKSRLSRRISQLENDLGVRLLQRSTRRFAVTDVGMSVHRHAQTMLAEA